MADDYLKFNSSSILGLIKSRLKAEGFNVSSSSSTSVVSETIAQVFELLLYQLNRTASSSSFAKTIDLESIINHAKLLGYKPIGNQASSALFDIVLKDTLDSLTYIIPRFSYVETPAGIFSTTEDTVFTNEFLLEETVKSDVILKGGVYVEHPEQFSNGDKNEVVTLSLGNNTPDHNSFSLFVKEPDGTWEEWDEVNSLFLSDSDAKEFEILYTGSGYELKLGDGINGYVPPVNSRLQIYYLAVNSTDALLSSNEVTEPLVRFSTTRLNNILSEISVGQRGVYINSVSDFFDVVNTTESTQRVLPETVEDIRRNAPNNFLTQNRLVSSTDYSSFISNNFSSFVSDVIVMNNEEYLDTYMSYFYDQGINNPLLEKRALFNQINFADSVNYNNVYFFVIPKNGDYLSEVQKSLIVEKVKPLKTLTSEFIPADPIYINYAVAIPVDALDFEDIDASSIRIIRSVNTNKNREEIRQEVYNTIKDYFTERAKTFENTVDVTQLNTAILNIDGVQESYTVNSGVELRGVNFYSYNPDFNNVTSAPPTSQFEKIFVPRLLDNSLLGRIVVE